MKSDQKIERDGSRKQPFSHRVFEFAYFWFCELRFRYNYRFVNPDASMATPPLGWSTHRNLAVVFDVIGIAMGIKAAKTFSILSIEDSVLVAAPAIGAFLIANTLLLGLFLPQRR